MGASRIPVKETVAVIVALALVSVANATWGTARSGYETLTHPGPPLSEREPGQFFGGDLDAALLASRRVIPRGQTFSVRVGQEPPVDQSILDAVTGLLRYWLLPRRYNENTRAVDWVITFHHPAETLGVPIRRVIPLGPDTNAVEVDR